MSRIIKYSDDFPEFSGASIGGPVYPPYATVVNDAPFQTVPNNNDTLGDVIVDKFGGQYVYVRTVAGLAQGQVVMNALGTAGTVTVSAAFTTVTSVLTNITTTIREDSVGSFLASTGTAAGGGTNFVKLIKKAGTISGGTTFVPGVGANACFVLSLTDIFFGVGKNDGDALPSIPTTGDPLILIRPFAVDVAGAGKIPVGVALGTVTSGNRTLVQTAGLAQVLAVGSTDALTDGGYVTTAAAGVVKGVLGAPTGPSDAVEIPGIVGVARQPYVSATSKLVAVSLWDLTGRF